MVAEIWTYRIVDQLVALNIGNRCEKLISSHDDVDLASGDLDMRVQLPDGQRVVLATHRQGGISKVGVFRHGKVMENGQTKSWN